MSQREKVEKCEYHFRVRGHGQDVPAGSVFATSPERAFKAAGRRFTKNFALKGWELWCAETGILNVGNDA
jgi:hypothetical protein